MFLRIKECGSELAHEGWIPAAENLADVMASSRASSLPQDLYLPPDSAVAELSI